MTFQEMALALAPHAASVANFCDHVEHNEPADRAWVLDAAEELRALSLSFSEKSALDLIALYAERLGAIEARNPLYRAGDFDGHASALEAKTWGDLQAVQGKHDRRYHADVVGLSKAEQLRHYALHLPKIVGAFANGSNREELIYRRLPDTLLFSIKLQTVMGKRLPEDPLPVTPSAKAAFPAHS